MSPINLGNYLVLENCSKIRVSDVISQAKKQIEDVLRSSKIEIGNQLVQLISTDTNFNGKRPWFLCPSCCTKRSFLYKHPISGLLECRKCLGLDYKDQRYKGMNQSPILAS